LRLQTLKNKSEKDLICTPSHWRTDLREQSDKESGLVSMHMLEETLQKEIRTH